MTDANPSQTLDWTTWSPDDVATWLETTVKVPPHIYKLFREKGIDGPTLSELTMDDIFGLLGGPASGPIAKAIVAGIKGLKELGDSGNVDEESGDTGDNTGDTEMAGRRFSFSGIGMSFLIV